MDLETLLKYSGMEKDVSESRMSDLDIEAQDNSRKDFIDMHSKTFGSDEEAGKFWDDSKEANESVETEAVGTAADPIMDLCDDLGCDPDHPIFAELVRYMDGDTIRDFVADFRRNHDMPNGMDETTEVATEVATEEVVDEASEEPIAENNKEAAGKAVKHAYDSVYEYVGKYDDAALEYLDNNAPMYTEMFQKYEDLDVMISKLDYATLKQIADELYYVADQLEDGVLESKEVEEADVQETVEVAVDDLASLMSLAGLQADTQAAKALDEYSNSPDEDYMDADMQLNKLSGGLNGPKAHTRKEGPGDNPLAAKLADQLQALMSK